MTALELAALLLPLVAAAFGIWFGLRLTGRLGIVAVDRPASGKIIRAILLTIALVAGLAIGNRGEAPDLGLVLLGLLFWSVMLFVTFRRRKRN
jgi:hypothetical protein